MASPHSPSSQLNISGPYHPRHVAGLSQQPQPFSYNANSGPFGWQPPPPPPVPIARPRLDLPVARPAYRGPMTPPLSASPLSAGGPRLPSPSPRSPMTPPWSVPSTDDSHYRPPLRHSNSTQSTNNKQNRRSPLGIDAPQYLIPDASGLEERLSSASLHTLDIEWAGELPPEAPEVRNAYAELDLEWNTIFDADDHRIPVMKATWFQDDWEVAGVYQNHVLFMEKAEKKKRVQIYDILDDSLKLVDTKYEQAGLSFDGKFLLVTYKGVMSMLNCNSRKVVKKFKTKEMHVRKWTSNEYGFCWVDNDGTFWRWSYESSGDPEQVFKLQANAPRYWLTPITTQDGSWYAICATEKERRRGVVHCYPEDNGEARVFEGPSAGAFTYEEVNGRTELGIVLLSVVNEKRGSHVAFDLHGITRGSRLRRHGKASVSITSSMKLLPEMYLDPNSSLVLVAISTASTDGSLCMLFDRETGQCAATRKINMDAGDRIHVGSASGMHLEQHQSLFRRLTIHPDGLPRPDSAGTGAAPIGLRGRRSFESWRSDDYGSNSNSSQYGSGTKAGTSEFGGGPGGRPPAPKGMTAVGSNFARGLTMGADDDSWMLDTNRPKKKR